MKHPFVYVLIVLTFVSSVYAGDQITLWSNMTFNQDSVDNLEIRWWWSTKYTTELNNSIATWNNQWSVNIAPDTAFTIEDLTIQDVFLEDPSNDYIWMWEYFSSWVDYIYLNTYYLDWFSSAWSFSFLEKQKTITHEWWHSLWLAHSFAWNIMQQWKMPRINLGTQDISSYDTKW